MNLFAKTLFAVAFVAAGAQSSFSQTAYSNTVADKLPKDYLGNAFHTGRREALRKMMPDNSVAVVFAYPERVFSNDVNYVYHPSPDLYYFSGYKEPDAVLLIFKEPQHDANGDFTELFYVRERNPSREQWTGRRLGVEGTKAVLGFQRVYNSSEFANLPIDLKKFSSILYTTPDVMENDEAGSTGWLAKTFRIKTGIEPIDKDVLTDLDLITARGTPKNVGRIASSYLKPKMERESYKKNALLTELYNKPDSATLADVKSKFNTQFGGVSLYSDFMNKLRGVKTPEEIDQIRKAVVISSYAHAEAMRAVRPDMSEHELQGIYEYVHRKYGAEDEGYPPIVGAGANSCILHYEENDVMHVDNQLVLADVGAMYHGYSADVTRTYPANGKFTEEQKAIYQLVYNAQEEVFKLAKAGVPYSKLEEKTGEVLTAGLIKLGIITNPKDLRIYYPHGVSHHMGLDVHDDGDYDTNLIEGMVITVEPGIYIPANSKCDKKWWNIGVRIEDDVVIGKDNCTILSIDAPRKWQDVEKTAAEKSIFDKTGLPELK